MKIKRLQFSVFIKADKAKIWKVLWDDDTYRTWTSYFFEGSYMQVSNWDEGSTAFFLNPEKNGIYSNIEKHIPNESISFKHIGNVKNEEKQPLDDETLKWSGCTESYWLTKKEDGFILHTELDTVEDYIESTNKVFPKALAKIKELSEN